jgi:pimeloyl-ACP methyl ester carboxylesterase
LPRHDPSRFATTDILIMILRSIICYALAICATALPTRSLVNNNNRAISQSLLNSLEELARIVDISYCVGSTGIQPPFKCLSRCSEFPGFELVTSWNTGPLLSDSCGYIAISHPPHPKRIIVAFRGTYSIANTIADLSTTPSEYLPFPSDNDNESICTSATETNSQGSVHLVPQLLSQPSKRSNTPEPAECANCTVHAGFLTSWRNTRCTIIPHVETALNEHPDYQLVLVGHSLGGAVAALAALEFQGRGWTPQVTTFGEPRLGNQALNVYMDKQFGLTNTSVPAEDALYRRVTHVDDPVPLLPLEEWGYRMHAGEVFISKPSLAPSKEDVVHCAGDEDVRCIQGNGATSASAEDLAEMSEDIVREQGMWTVPPRYKLWELFFAHRDYFWRLGLCVPGGDPWNWKHDKYGSALDEGTMREFEDELR